MKYVVVAILGGGLLLLASRLVRESGTLTQPFNPSPTPMNDSSSNENSQQDPEMQAITSEQSADSTTEQSTETNPLKRYQDLVNSPATPDGHKVVAAVAAASTVTVAAVANWIMKATKK